MKTSKTVILTLCLLLVFTVFPAQAFADEGEVYKTLDLGTMYQYYDCFVYVPAETDENTACCVHFAGGSGGWLLRQDYAVRYIQQYAPNSIFIWYKNSGIYEMAARVERTVSLLSSLEAQTGLDFGTVTITASSNGGYTSLYAASHLKSDYEIATDRVIILDMGNVWGKSEFLISKAEALLSLAFRRLSVSFPAPLRESALSGMLRQEINSRAVSCEETARVRQRLSDLLPGSP